MEESHQQPDGRAKDARAGGTAKHFVWAGAVVMLGGCALAAFTFYQCSPGTQSQELAAASTQVGGALAQGLGRLVAAMKTDQVVETFREHLVSLQPDLQGRLLVADVKDNEEFDAADSNWFGTTTADIRVPVTYLYFVALDEPWQLRVRVGADGVVTGDVIAPDLRPLQPPAIDTGRMEIKGDNGWLRWDKGQVQADLLKTITLRCAQRGAQKVSQYFPLARAGVEKFVRDWILKEYQIPANVPVYLRVTFHNEAPAGPGAPSAPSG
jgi:hypothetical protein